MSAFVDSETLLDFTIINRAVEKLFSEDGYNRVKIPAKLCYMSARRDIPAMLAGSAGAVAAKYLCPKREIMLGLIGAGPRAENQLEALSQEFAITAIKVWDSDRKLADEFCKKYSRFSCRICNPKIACDCDLLVTTTPSRIPVVRARWIRAGTHINAMGADEPGKEELDPSLVAIGRVFVSNREEAIRAGEINVPVTKGFFSPDRIAGTLREVVVGTKGRLSDSEITIFVSAGLAPGSWPSSYGL